MSMADTVAPQPSSEGGFHPLRWFRETMPWSWLSVLAAIILIRFLFRVL